MPTKNSVCFIKKEINMEFALPELFNREDIIKILNHRQLHVQNMHELTLDELLRLYKTFVMPLSRRPERSKKIKQSTRNENIEGHNMEIECSDSSCNTMDIDFMLDGTCNAEQILNDRMTSPAGEKRRQRSSDEDIFDMFENDYQYQLSSVTKRIRINSLS